MKRGGAREVLAVDYSDHRLGQLDAVRHYHGVDFDFRTVGLMYDLHRQLRGRSFDLVNCSGLLYHVFSPLSILAAIRPLVKRGGIVLVSTSVTLDNGYTMDFNAGGRMLAEVNTFWYLSARLFDYMLRYMRLAPIDCAFMPHSDPRIAASHSFDKPSGYVSVACRAVDHAADDDWMGESSASAWDYLDLSDWERADRQPKSTIGYRGESGDGSFDLVEAIRTRTPVTAPGAEEDSHLLRLSATS
jgi:SAM-dependent methyltransferase